MTRYTNGSRGSKRQLFRAVETKYFVSNAPTFGWPPRLGEAVVRGLSGGAGWKMPRT